MSIWILAFICFGLFAAIGYMKGAIRMTVSLLGFFIAAMSALPLAPMFKPLVPLMKIQNPVIQPLVPPVIAFFLVELVFVGLGFYIHRLVALHYKYKTDDLTRSRWERLNQRTGVSIGLVAGAAHFVLVCLIIYVAGYFTMQVTPETSNSTALNWLNTARSDMAKTGVDRLVAPMDPTKPSYYQIGDLLGLIYHNPVLTGRLSNYPAYLGMEDRQEFQDIGSDTEYMQLIQTKSELGTVLNNPKTQAIISNQELMQAILGVDLKDLKTYLETGKSPKYDDEKILGRWRLEPNAILRQIKRRKQDISAAELGQIKKIATTALIGVTFMASPDNKAILKVPAAPAPPPAPDGQDPAAQQQAGNPYAGDPALAQRYGIQPQRPRLGSATSIAGNLRQRLGSSAPPAPPRGPGAPAVATPQPVEPPIDLTKAATAGQGSWSSDGGSDYAVTLTSDQGKEFKLKASFENDRLVLAGLPIDLVFERIR